MNGLHLTADLRACPPGQAALTAPEALRALCLGAVERAGLRAVGELFHRFAPPASGAPGGESAGPEAATGVTGVVLLAESHLAVHTWPELGAVTLDAFVCNLRADNSARAHALMETMIEAFAPGRVERHALQRGDDVRDEGQS